jgi:glycerol-3-phosphate cytidylyltransferase
MKTGFACGVFDLFHAGHVLMLKECKDNCDYLIVALNQAINLSSDKNTPIYTIEERKLILESCKYVDEVITYSNENQLTNILKNRKIDIRFLGDDYKDNKKRITSPELVKEIFIINRDHGFSTSRIKNLIEKIEK